MHCTSGPRCIATRSPTPPFPQRRQATRCRRDSSLGQKTVSACGKGASLLVASKKERKPLAPHKREPAPPDRSLRHPPSVLRPPGHWAHTPDSHRSGSAAALGCSHVQLKIGRTHAVFRLPAICADADRCLPVNESSRKIAIAISNAARYVCSERSSSAPS